MADPVEALAAALARWWALDWVERTGGQAAPDMAHWRQGAAKVLELLPPGWCGHEEHDCFWDAQPVRAGKPQDIESLRMDVTDAEADAFLSAVEDGVSELTRLLAVEAAAREWVICRDAYLDTNIRNDFDEAVALDAAENRLRAALDAAGEAPDGR